MVVTALHTRGYEVTGVASGDEAVDCVLDAIKSDHPYDVVILDNAMPGMDGLTCAKKLLDAYPETGAKLHIEFLTGHPDLKLPKILLDRFGARQWDKLNVVEMLDRIESEDRCARAAQCAERVMPASVAG